VGKKWGLWEEQVQANQPFLALYYALLIHEEDKSFWMASAQLIIPSKI
jgi:hypothetical protein